MVRRCSLFEVPSMTADAFRREPETVELSHGPHLVTRIAIHHSVCADQRKPILVLIDVVDRDLPAVGVVAQLAFSPVLPPMKVRVAVLTLVWSVGEFEVGMAVAAGDGSMATAKGESRLCMIKLDPVRNHLPIRGGVTGSAR